MDPPTHQELVQISQLRDHISGLSLPEEKLKSDYYLLRWIRARDHKMKDAEDMLKKHLKWRESENISSLVNWEPPEEIAQAYPFGIVGFDRMGCPVIAVPFGKWDLRKIAESALRHDMLRHFDRIFEITETLMRKRSTVEKPCTQFLLILDFSNYSYWQLASVKNVELMMDMVKRFEANHPETLRMCLTVNGSTLYHMVFKLMKPFMSPKTIGKVRIFDSDSEKWKPEVAKEVAKEELPVYFGGSASCSIDCYRKVEKAGNEDLTTISVGAGETYEIKVEVPVGNYIIKWKWRTDYFDMGFQVVLKNGDDELEMLPYEKMDSQIRFISGQLCCKEVGQYIARFDNSYSRLRAKMLYYSVTLVNLEQE